MNGQFLTQARREGDGEGEAADPEGGGERRDRKPFHAFRSTFDRLCRERGQNPEFIQAQMGHSDPRLTLVHYGQWSEVGEAGGGGTRRGGWLPV